ncbi:integrase core domain-containing protein [Neisseria iguanae]|uniref:integrase core domain-containing protein n=1 Tax=Neisseria iguanae TaxID=90242 RepID=UPI003CCC0311
MVCQKLGIEHGTTKFRHPWVNGQVGRTNKMLKQAAVKAYHYEDIGELRRHLLSFVLYYSHQKPLKFKGFKTPWQLMRSAYESNPPSFLSTPQNKAVGRDN